MTAQIIQFKANTADQASKCDNDVRYHHYSYAGNLLRKENASHSRGWDNRCGEQLGSEDMKCCTCSELDAKLQDFVDGEVDEITRQRLVIHLESCDEFRRSMEQYQMLKMAAAAVGAEMSYDPAIGSRLRARLHQELGLKLKA